MKTSPYFTPAVAEFFAGLTANNTREWFESNKKTFEKEVKKPMEALLADLLAEQAKADPSLPALKPSDCMFRIYRDVRFSKDKSPYKTALGAVVGYKGRKSEDGFYLQVSHQHLAMGGGLYDLQPAELKLVRPYLAEHRSELEALLAAPAFAKLFGGQLHGDKNKVLPAELKEAAEAFPLLYQRQYYYWTELPVETIWSPKLYETVLEHYRAAQPLNRFFRQLSLCL